MKRHIGGGTKLTRSCLVPSTAATPDSRTGGEKGRVLFSSYGVGQWLTYVLPQSQATKETRNLFLSFVLGVSATLQIRGNTTPHRVKVCEPGRPKLAKKDIKVYQRRRLVLVNRRWGGGVKGAGPKKCLTPGRRAKAPVITQEIGKSSHRILSKDSLGG